MEREDLKSTQFGETGEGRTQSESVAGAAPAGSVEVTAPTDATEGEATPENREVTPEADALNNTESGAESSASENTSTAAAVQPLPEKVYRPAGFFIRLVAYLMDLMVINGVLVIVGAVTAYPVKELPMVAANLMTVGLAGALYFTLMTRFFGQTLGKMITGIRVIQKDGKAPGFLAAIFRETVGRTLSQLLGLHMGYWWCAFHPKKQGWHDLISDTYVVYDRTAERAREIRIPVASAPGESF